MATNESYTLSEQNQAAVNEYVASGKFESADEVVKAGLDLLHKEQRRIEALRQAIEEGEASGIDEDFDLENFRKRIYADYLQ